MKITFRPARISSQALRIQSAPSDRTTSYSVSSTPFWSVTCRGQAPVLSFCASPVFGSRLSAVKQAMAFASLVFGNRLWNQPMLNRAGQD